MVPVLLWSSLIFVFSVRRFNDCIFQRQPSFASPRYSHSLSAFGFSTPSRHSASPLSLLSLPYNNSLNTPFQQPFNSPFNVVLHDKMVSFVTYFRVRVGYVILFLVFISICFHFWTRLKLQLSKGANYRSKFGGLHLPANRRRYTFLALSGIESKF